MRLLLLHNAYREAGGEDAVLARERALLAGRGHDVHVHAVCNRDVAGAWGSLRTAVQLSYSPSARRAVAAEIDTLRPDVVHVHNFFPLLTPSVYDACRAARVPVVQTLHNYRLVCPSGVCFRDGDVCEDCVGRGVAWPAVLHRCYRGSRGGSAAVAAMLGVHRARGTWADHVDVYVAPTEFARRTFIRGGLPPEKIVVKPHFVDPDPGPGDAGGGYALFAGRLSPGKGVRTLLQAWAGLGPAIPLKIVGDGPLAGEVAAAAGGGGSVEWLGRQPSEVVLGLMKRARALIFPSLFYETFGIVIAEAYAAGLPVITADGGSGASLVSDGRTGLHFRRGDAADLAAKVTLLWARDDLWGPMRAAARHEFERRYTAAQNYRDLMDVYALARRTSRAPDAASGRWRALNDPTH